jgi:hypothetical protein
MVAPRAGAWIETLNLRLLYMIHFAINELARLSLKARSAIGTHAIFADAIDDDFLLGRFGLRQCPSATWTRDRGVERSADQSG